MPDSDLNLAGFGEDADENIYENRKRFLSLLDGEFRLSTVWQVHSDSIRTIDSMDAAENTEERHDAMISNLSGVLLGVKTADCVPVLIGDRARGVFAAVHAGWRGTASSIAAKTVAKMVDIYSSRPAELICAIGPSAGPRSYEIGQEVIDAFRSNFTDANKYFRPTSDGHALIDLPRANRDQLTAAGVPAGNISASPYCTMERTDLFFSYRVEKKLYGRTGRLMSVIGRAA
jgi:YfiH family protein